MNGYRECVASFYDARAEGYEAAFVDQPFQAHAKDFLEHAAKGGTHVLDVGCGPGHLTADLPESICVVGTDISSAMIGKAKIRGPSGSYFEHDYLVALPPALRDFDVILASGCFDLCEDVGKALRLLAERLKEDGLFYFTVLERRESIPHQAAGKINARPDRENPIWLWLWSFHQVAMALDGAGLVPVRYECAAGCKSRTLDLDFFYGYWIVTRT